MTVQIFSWQNFQGVVNRNLLNLRNLRLNLFRLLGLKARSSESRERGRRRYALARPGEV